MLAFPGCRTVTVLLDEARGWAASVVLYDTLEEATRRPTDIAYWRTLADLDEILDLAGATREVYAVVDGAPTPARPQGEESGGAWLREALGRMHDDPDRPGGLWVRVRRWWRDT